MDRVVADGPVAIIGFETTGLVPGGDRVVEVSVVLSESGQPPLLALDTLVNPGRPVGATDIHGITDADVAGAPPFEEIAGNLVDAVSDCVLAMYNVQFDMPFLVYELQRIGVRHSPPHVCLMSMRPLLGLGARCSLDEACRAHGVDCAPSQRAAHEAMAAARLWRLYLQTIERRGLRTFGDIARLKASGFVQSFSNEPLSRSLVQDLRPASRLKPRTSRAAPALQTSTAPVHSPARQAAIHTYWEGLKAVLFDLNVTDEEVASLAKQKERLGLTLEEVRAVHARAFVNALSRCVEDKLLDDTECNILHRLHRCLRRLGWAPGD